MQKRTFKLSKYGNTSRRRIPSELCEAMLIWAKKENKLSLIERRQISNYIKKFENNRIFKTIKTAEKAIALKKKAELLGFSI